MKKHGLIITKHMSHEAFLVAEGVESAARVAYLTRVLFPKC